MPKNLDDVILPERRKSIRNIPIPEGRRRSDKAAPSLDGVKKPARTRAVVEEDLPPPQPPQHLEPRRERNKNPKRSVWIASAIGALIVIFGIMSFFSGGTLSYVPKTAALTFNNDVYTAVKSGDNALLYSVVKLSGDKGEQVAASGQSQVSRKASGTVVVYNNSSDVQKLVATTRFQASSGKVYRISQGITVPAKSGSQPGSVEAVVYADQPGDSYNSDPTDFTLPGLKGTSKFSLIYARSKTAISGGFVGMEKSVNPDDAAKAKTELQSSLSQELLAKAQAEVPDDFILFPSLSSVTFEDLPQSTSTGDTATINLRGNLYGIMFKKSDLAHALASKKLALTKDEAVDMNSYDSLQISFAGTAPADLLPLTQISFKVSGSATLVWKTDEVALKSDLVGRSKSELPSILQNYPSISSAGATIRPFWKTSFPTDAKNINIDKVKIQ